MGCTSTKESVVTIEQAYKEKKLPMPEPTDYENEFEKIAYMTINLIREDPKSFIKKVH